MVPYIIRKRKMWEADFNYNRDFLKTYLDFLTFACDIKMTNSWFKLNQRKRSWVIVIRCFLILYLYFLTTTLIKHLKNLIIFNQGMETIS